MGSVPINYIAVLAAALLGFVIGGLWYSPALFGKAWLRAASLSEEDVAAGNKARIFGFTFLFLLIMAYCLAMFLADPTVTLASGAFYGFLAGFGLAVLWYRCRGAFRAALLDLHPRERWLLGGHDDRDGRGARGLEVTQAPLVRLGVRDLRRRSPLSRQTPAR
jgi:hypothetical protein